MPGPAEIADPDDYFSFPTSSRASDRAVRPEVPRGQVALLVEPALLPGECRTLSARWDEETSALGALPASSPEVIVWPRPMDPWDDWPGPIGVRVRVDGRRRGLDGAVASIQVIGLRRVRLVRVIHCHPHLRVEVVEGSGTPEVTPGALRRLARLRGRLLAADALDIGDAEASALRRLRADPLTDALAVALDPEPHARLALVRTVAWPERLPLLTRLATRRLRRPSRVSRTSDRSSETLTERLERATLPVAVRRAAERALEGAHGMDGNVHREAVRVLLDLRWTAPPVRPIDLDRARGHLDQSHAGLQPVKDAVLDRLAVLEWRRRQGLPPAAAGATLCLVGPPGTGKTTAAQAIARATGRHSIRIALGGVDDIFLIGADRAYNRARPGEIVRSLRASGLHPQQVLFLLDEIDKLAGYLTHAPLPVLLALLDPAQNAAWQDHFLDEVRLDLSGALFVATANDDLAIPAPLRDRLHLIRLPSYRPEEQLAIARSHLVPAALADIGAADVLDIRDDAVRSLVLDYPAAPGLRGLQHRLATIITRAVRAHLETGQRIIVDRAVVHAWVPSDRIRLVGFHRTGG